MTKVLVTESHLEDIADAIRSKLHVATAYKPGQMAGAIATIPAGGVMIPKTIIANGEYDPQDDDADGYSGVLVAVPNTYTAGDEGMVVSGGALVAQTARPSEIATNGAYDTTLNNSVTVNVSGGGGIPTGTTAPTSEMGQDGDYYVRSFPMASNINFVEYLESTGTQYINTGVYATQDIDATVTSDRGSGTSGSGAYVGCALGVRSGSFSGMSKTMYFGSHPDNQGGTSVIKTGSSQSGSVDNVTGKQTRRTKTIKDINGYYVYYSTIDEKSGYSKLYRQTGTWQSTMPLCMFAFYQDTTLNVGKAKNYRVTIYDRSAPIHDYLPCLDTNNVPCMWDNVAGEYVYNDGTGDFAYGSALATPPDALEDVLYIKKNGAWEVVQ